MMEIREHFGMCGALNVALMGQGRTLRIRQSWRGIVERQSLTQDDPRKPSTP